MTAISIVIVAILVIAAAKHLRRTEDERNRARETLAERDAQMQLAMTGAGIGTWSWDPRINRVVWSDRCRELFGIRPNERFDYREFLTILHPEDGDRIVHAVHAALRSRTIYDVEYRILWPDDSVHWIAAKGHAVYDDEGEPLVMHGIAMDVSERKRGEVELQEARRAAEAANVA
jgi:PAS domain S-box-containing protein